MTYEFSNHEVKYDMPTLPTSAKYDMPIPDDTPVLLGQALWRKKEGITLKKKIRDKGYIWKKIRDKGYIWENTYT